MNWKFWKRKPTLDDVVCASFYEEGRWVADPKNLYIDTKTGAVITIGRSSQVILNGVSTSPDIYKAFWDAFYTQPREAKEKAKFDALKELYGCA